MSSAVIAEHPSSVTLTLGTAYPFTVVRTSPPWGMAGGPVVPTPRSLLLRLDEFLAAAPPSAGRLYATALRQLVVAIDATPDRFTDPQHPVRTTAFLVQRFLAADAALARQRPDDVPGPWRTALAVDPGLPAMRHLLVTANAGLNDDLPRALLELPGWDGSASRMDHAAWTELMADAFADAACPSAAGPVERVAALRERPLLRRALLAAGAQAWSNAEDLLHHRTAADDPDAADIDPFETRSRLLATLTVGNTGELLTRHRWPLPRWADLLVVRLQPA